ncbi:MAG: hypothetical protein AB8B78_02095 [Polaribacter sp.]
MIFCITSCDKFSFQKNTQNKIIDTIVDFSSVDTYPSFKVCDSLIDKQKKAACFRKTIHQKIGVKLQEFSFTIKDSIDKFVYVDVLINDKGVFFLDTILSSEKIRKEIPELDSLLKVSIQNLPTIFPAHKMGIPVTTKYRLPIKIKL